MAFEACARPLKAREGRNAFADAPRSAQGDDLTHTGTIAELIAGRSTELVIWLPAQANRGTVETLPVAREMKAALKTKLKRKLFRHRQAILQTDNGKAVGSVNPVLELITANHRSEPAHPGFNPERGFVTSSGRSKPCSCS